MAVRTPQEKSAINRMLGTHGLPPLESGAGLMVALGYLVRDHEHFRSLLIRCEPEKRTDMYNALRGSLRFTAKPLDVYIAESAMKAEREKLPTIDDKGEVSWPKNDPSKADIAGAREAAANLFMAQDAVNEAFAKKKLWLVCNKCSKEAVFMGDTKTDAIFQARADGWVYYEHTDKDGKVTPREICPECPAARKVD
jgi:hypothetical protein